MRKFGLRIVICTDSHGGRSPGSQVSGGNWAWPETLPKSWRYGVGLRSGGETHHRNHVPVGGFVHWGDDDPQLQLLLGWHETTNQIGCDLSNFLCPKYPPLCSFALSRCQQSQLRSPLFLKHWMQKWLIFGWEFLEGWRFPGLWLWSGQMWWMAAESLMFSLA